MEGPVQPELSWLPVSYDPNTGKNVPTCCSNLWNVIAQKIRPREARRCRN